MRRPLKRYARRYRCPRLSIRGGNPNRPTSHDVARQLSPRLREILFRAISVDHVSDVRACVPILHPLVSPASAGSRRTPRSSPFPPTPPPTPALSYPAQPTPP